MKALLQKSLLFAGPFLIFGAMELFVLPIDAFTFRVWEAARNLNPYFQGPFLPNLHVRKVEGGDLRLPNGPTKEVEWFTDSFGYRNRPRSIERYDVVAVGDSHFVGAFLDQRNTFEETLERHCDCLVYNHAYNGPGDLATYLKQERFARSPPSLVLMDFRPIDLYVPARRYPPIPDEPPSPPAMGPAWRTTMETVHARFMKKAAINWSRAKLGLAITAIPYSKALESRPISSEELASVNGSKAATIFAGYKKLVEARGSRFAMFLVGAEPAVEDGLRPIFNKLGIDLLSFPRVKDPHAAYFQTADSHWTERGTEAAASVVAAYLRERGLVGNKTNRAP
jgi:hypothetical protein